MSASFTSRKGLGLLELTLGLGLLAVLFLATAFVLRQTFAAQHKIDSESSLSQQFQAAGSLLTQEVMASCEAGLTRQSSALAVLIPQRPYDFSGLESHLVWQAHSVYYFHAATGELRRREVPLATPSDIPVALATLPSSGGRVLARSVDQVVFEQSGPLIRVRLSGRQRRYRGEEQVNYETVASCRN